jgi:hypothetical protein
MASILALNTEQEMLARATLEPVFDPDGNIVGIRQLKVQTDRRLGIKAMRDLFAESEKDDHQVGSDGWTRKQRRLLSTPAPKPCHYLKQSRRWDAAQNKFVPKITILLPYEVVWAMFDLMFEGQYSIEIDDVESQDEEIMSSGHEMPGQKIDDALGRLFYARAKVSLKLHLANGQVRTYEGLGVSYGAIPMNQTGNMYAINNARRTAEKGAVSDAKREALSNIGPIFRRAFEDGDEMIEVIEKMLLEELQERNRPKLQVAANATRVPAPAPRKKPKAVESAADADQAPLGQTEAAADFDPSTQIQEDDLDQVFGPGPSEEDAVQTADQTVEANATTTSEEDQHPQTIELHLTDKECRDVPASDWIEVFMEHAFATVETEQDLDALIALNKAELDRIASEHPEIEGLRAELVANAQPSVAEDGIPDFDVDLAPGLTIDASQAEETRPDDAFIIEVGSKSGRAVLTDFKALIDAATSADDLDRIVRLNKEALRKLTPKQMGSLTDIKSEKAKSYKAE